MSEDGRTMTSWLYEYCLIEMKIFLLNFVCTVCSSPFCSGTARSEIFLILFCWVRFSCRRLRFSSSQGAQSWSPVPFSSLVGLSGRRGSPGPVSDSFHASQTLGFLFFAQKLAPGSPFPGQV
jgi:hypothetical protein